MTKNHPTSQRPGLTGNDPVRLQQGVALLEVLVAILLFSFGILGLIGLQARAISYSTDAEDRNRATMLANEISTTMWLNNSLTVPPDTLTQWKARVADAKGVGLTNGLGDVTITGNAADVVITWRAPSRTDGIDSRLITRVVIP